MHKLSVSLFGVMGLATASIFLIFSIVRADNVASWINSELSLQKQADTQSLPSTVNGYGNIDCTLDSSSCSVSTPYGVVTNAAIRFNSTGSSYPVLSYLESKQRFIPIPNSNTGITYLTSPVFGLYLYFNHNLSSSITPTFLPGTTQKAYQINRAPDGMMADKASNRLAADTESMSFSTNGRWMVVSIPNIALARVNLQTFEVLPFGTKFNYGIGLSPSAKTAITNDGRYAIVASKNQSRFLLYDLETCAAAPSTISGPISCQSRDLKSFMTQQAPGFDSVVQARFLTDDLMAIYASYNANNALKTARFLIGNTDITSQIDYLALGDSFISGEGALNYKSGTDTADNYCHLSLVSYPYLIGPDLNFSSYNSVACSGAKVKDITNTSIPYGSEPQMSGKADAVFDDEIYNNFLPGYRAQIEFIVRYRPQTIMVSIGGNDIGFSNILQRCILSTGLCYSTYEDRLELIRLINNQLFHELVFTYKSLKAAGSPDGRIYAIGYPQIAKPDGDCAVNVRLSSEELLFGQQLTAYLNSVIEKAAAKAGVYYVDTQDALNGHRLCEAAAGSVGVNGLTAGTDFLNTIFFDGPFGNESYHPNELGHRLLKIEILEATNNLTDPMPAPNPSTGPPPENGLEILNAPRQGRGVNISQYNESMANDVLLKEVFSEIDVRGLDHSLKPGGSYRLELHSTVVNLGNFSADSNGNINTTVQIPADVPTGIHTLRLYGRNLAGENIDVYKNVYVAASEDDFDGDGVDNDEESCSFVEPSDQDFDQDGIDDACDGSINQPPVLSSSSPPEPQASTSSDPQVQSPEAPQENTETQDQPVVLGSTISGGTQRPLQNTVTSSFVNDLSFENKNENTTVKVLSGTTSSTDSTGILSKFKNIEQQWQLLATISITAAAALGILYKKAFAM